MKVSADRATLLAAVAAVAHHAGSGGCLVTAAADVTVASAGPEGGARRSAAGEVAAVGSAVFPLGPLAQILRGSAGGPVELDARPGAGRVVVRTDAGRFEFPAGDPAAFPAWPSPAADAYEVTVPADDFRRAVARSAVAADRRENPAGRWATTGVLVTLGPGGVRFCATDTHRLADAGVALTHAAPHARALAPARTIRAWADAARGADRVTLTLWPAGSAFAAGPLSAWTSLISGTFPVAGLGLLDAPRPHACGVVPAQLLAAAELALVAADADERGVALRAEPGRVTVSAESAEQGSARVEVPADGYTGQAVTIQLDGRRLAEYLAAVEAEERVSFAWDAPGKPVLFTAADGSRYLQVPLVERAEHGRAVA